MDPLLARGDYRALPPPFDLANESGSDESDGEDYFPPPPINVYSTESSRGSAGNCMSVTLDVDSWLAELDTLTLRTDLDTRPVDPFRFSQATLEDTQEDELNAILGELSALQQSLDREIKPLGQGSVTSSSTATGQGTTHHVGQGNMNLKGTSMSIETGGRTESPDNDSGFSDNASLLSSGSSLSAGGSSSGSSTTSSRLKPSSVSISPSSVLHPNELAALLNSRLESYGPTSSCTAADEKAEKIRVALAKMRAASVTRLYVKAFSPDGSSKALMVEESMSCGRVLALLADKNHVPLSHKWTLVEHLPHLHMERIYEDHENMVENLLMWTRDSKNKIYFVERDDKYDMFQNPQRYFGPTLPSGPTPLHSGPSLDEHGRTNVIEEFFRHGHGVPEVESSLYLKAEGKKAWKKFSFVLRASGVYYFPKGKAHANPSKDLVCLGTIDHNIQAYEGVGWRKKFKAPTEFGFALKPARLQVKSHRHMKYLCAEDIETLQLWMVGLRIAKYGKVLWENYRSLQEDIAHEDLDRFGRSVSLASMPIQISTYHQCLTNNDEGGKGHMVKYPPTEYAIPSVTHGPVTLHNHSTPENSNGDRMVLLVNPPPPPPPTSLQTIVAVREEGFESDAPMGGTIKRKPSTVLSPKIPLTLNTRSLVSEYITPGEGNTVTLAHTLQRKRSVSGNAGGGTTSSSSCSSTMSSPVTTNPPIICGKPPCGPMLGGKPLTVPDSVGEETLDSLEMANLPPPPPELLEYGGCDEVNVISSSPESVYAHPPSILKVGTLPNSMCRQISIESQSSSQSLPKKGVTFANELSQRLMNRNQGSPTPPPLSTKLSLPLQPPPHPTSSPAKRMEEPPPDFLSDLQRVMQKKWQVAQKCTVSNSSPQEILGFRFEPNALPESPTSEECQSENGDPVNPAALNNVRAWVSQHYGTANEDLPRKPIPPLPNAKPVQRVTFSANTVTVTSPPYNPPPIYQAPSNVVIYENFQGRKHSLPTNTTGMQMGMSNNYNQIQLRNKKPPPPIPKRADSTHLSAHFVYN